MRINSNTTALRAVYYANTTDSKVSASINKLTSGNKIVNISDNPVGASLSVKMKTQIRSLNRASQNASDGVSIVDTAESALAEIQSMLQRVGELAVQGSNDTYTDEDRANIAEEIDQINQEINRICEDTDFNSRTLLDGTLSRALYTSNNAVELTSVSMETPSAKYKIYYNDTAQQATYSTGTFSAGSYPSGTMDINGAQVSISAGDSLQDIYEKFMEAGKKTGLDVTYNGSLTGDVSFTFTQQEYGFDKVVDISTSEDLANALGIDKDVEVRGADGTVELDDGFASSAVATASGRDIIIKDSGGFEMKVSVNDEWTKGKDGYVTLGIADAGTMTIQVGANEYQELDVDIPRVDTQTLGTDKILAYTSRGCEEAITIANDAINMISTIRGRLGAYENRMEHTVNTLDATEENMTASLSRIQDVDIADEMTNYTTYNVMSQAAISMLSQANQMSDKVLALLQ